MSQVLVTLDSLRSYARSLDNRVKDKNKYSDSWVDGKINAAYELVATKTQPFLNEEVLDLTSYIQDGTLKFEVDMDYDVAGWKDIFYTIGGDAATDPYWVGVMPRATAVTWVVTPDNKVEIDLENNLDADYGYNMYFQYYYFPHTSTGDQYFSTDIYHMVRHGIASSVYDALRDYEKRDNFDTQLEYNARTHSNARDMDGGDVVKNNWTLI